MASPTVDERPLEDLSDWELVARNCPKADEELKRKCLSLAEERVERDLQVLQRLGPLQEGHIVEMIKPRRWQTTMKHCVGKDKDKGDKNRPDDVALVFADSGEVELYLRLRKEALRTVMGSSCTTSLPAHKKLDVLDDRLGYLLVDKGRKTMTRWLLGLQPDQQGKTAPHLQGDSCIGYVRESVINKAISEIKKILREPELVDKASKDDLDVPVREIGCEQISVEEQLIAEREAERLGAILAQELSPTDWTIVRLSDDEATSEEIAEVFNISVGAARVRKSRALARAEGIIRRETDQEAKNAQ